ncbi:MAG: cation diffusion facilitator family transporter, partial [Acidimicrobiales bacterium]
ESSEKGIRAVKISLVALMVTAILQVLIVLVTGSVALLADTIHNFSDALTSIPLWIAFVLGRRAATKSYTYGYRRAEDIAGLFIVAMIALSAVLAAWESVDRLFNPRDVEYLGLVAAAGIVGFIGNEFVAIYRIRVGREIGSAALVADGYHARTDGLTSLAVLFGAIGVAMGFPAADPIIGLMITVAILFILRDATKQVFRRLMDGVDPHTVDDVAANAASVDGVLGVEDVRVRWIGHRLDATVQVVVDEKLSLIDGHEIAHEVTDALEGAMPNLDNIVVHVEPGEAGHHDQAPPAVPNHSHQEPPPS